MDHSYGLGLSIAERIVKSHHGKIWAESANGSNTFWCSCLWTMEEPAMREAKFLLRGRHLKMID